MKTKIIIISLFTVIFVGCSKDDSPEETVIPPNEKFLKTVADADGGVLLSFENNTDKNIERMKISNNILFVYGYEENLIISTEVYGENPSNFTFTYDVNGHLSSFTNDDVTTIVTYNAAQNYYFYKKENGDEESIFIDEDGDAKKFVSYDKSEDDTKTILVLHESGSYKGTLINTNNPLIATSVVDSYYNLYFLVFNLSKKPIRTITIEGLLDFVNTFDEQGFLKSSTYGSDNNTTTYNYNYIKL